MLIEFGRKDTAFLSNGIAKTVIFLKYFETCKGKEFVAESYLFCREVAENSSRMAVNSFFAHFAVSAFCSSRIICNFATNIISICSNESGLAVK